MDHGLAAKLIPLAVFFLMVAMGLDLRVADFRRAATDVRATLTGVLSQLLLMPLVGIGLALTVAPDPAVAMGLAVLSACPSGPVSNGLSHLVRADVALSLTLNAIVSVLAIFTTPIVVSVACRLLLDADANVTLPLDEAIGKMAFITIVPVGSGMLLRHFKPALAERVGGPLTQLGGALLLLLWAGVMWGDRANVLPLIPRAGFPTFLLLAVTMLAAAGVARLVRLGRQQAVTVIIEVGVQNMALAALISITLLQRPDFGVVAGVYSLVNFVVLVPLVVLFRRNPGWIHAT